MFYTYILKSQKNGRYYIGCTEDIERRFQLHNAGRIYSTKNYRPWKIVYFESFPSLAEALSREKQIKGWKKRAVIERLIKHFRI